MSTSEMFVRYNGFNLEMQVGGGKKVFFSLVTILLVNLFCTDSEFLTR